MYSAVRENGEAFTRNHFSYPVTDWYACIHRINRAVPTSSFFSPKPNECGNRQSNRHRLVVPTFLLHCPASTYQLVGHKTAKNRWPRTRPSYLNAIDSFVCPFPFLSFFLVAYTVCLPTYPCDLVTLHEQHSPPTPLDISPDKSLSHIAAQNGTLPPLLTPKEESKKEKEKKKCKKQRNILHSIQRVNCLTDDGLIRLNLPPSLSHAPDRHATAQRGTTGPPKTGLVCPCLSVRDNDLTARFGPEDSGQAGVCSPR